MRYCKNCDAPVLWGAFCCDCVRAFIVGSATALGGALVAWVLK